MISRRHRTRVPLGTAALCALALAGSARAEGPSIGGFYSTKLVSLYRAGNEFQDPLEFRNKLYLKAADTPWEGVKIHLSGRFDYNAILTDSGTGKYDHLADIHEAYASLSYQNFDISLGQEKVSWGKADLSVVDNVNPSDLTELIFIEEEFSKVPIPLVRAEYFADPVKVEAVAVPFYTPARFTITGRNWSILSPWIQNFLARTAEAQGAGSLSQDSLTVLGTVEYPKDDVLSSGSGGFRLSGSRDGYDAGISYLYGWEPLPSFFFNPDFIRMVRSQPGDLFDKLATVSALDVAAFYPLFIARPRRINHAGVEFGTIVHDIGIRAEGDLGYRRGFLTNNLEILERPVVQWTVGADYTFPGDIYINAQFLQVVIVDYRTDIFIFKRVNNSLVGFIRRNFLEDKIQPEIRGMANLTQGDYYISARLSYQWTDAMKITGAVNYMEGPLRTSMLGFYADESHAVLQIRYAF